MSAVLTGAALLCAVLALLVSAVVLVRTREVRQPLAVLLDLLLAAGLLQASADATPAELGGLAAVVLVRVLAVRAVSSG